MAENVFEVEIPLRWGDMDAYGHVNNVTMFQILEEARVAVFGMPPSSGEPVAESPGPRVRLFETFPDGVQALIAEHHAKYHSPLPYRGLKVKVDVAITAVTAASFTISYRVFDPHTSTLCVSASTVLAFFNATTGTLTRLNKEQRNELESFIN